jgi:hypothetical protein
MSKKITKCLILALILTLLIPSVALAGDHPSPQSGNPSDYAGTWIINGKTESDTNWTLEINEDGTYSLSNEYQSFEGEYTFLPSQDPSMGDRLWFQFDPALGVELLLENMANGLVDISGQGLIFVRPGNKANIDEFEELEEIHPEAFLGEWRFDSISISTQGFNFTFSAEEILSDSGGEEEIVLSLKDRIISQLSVEHKLRAPIARYRWISKDTFIFKNPIKMDIFQIYTGLIVDPTFMVMMAHPEPEDTSTMLFFSRIEGVSWEEEVED